MTFENVEKARIPATPRRASSIIKNELIRRGLPFTRVYARTIDFTDLARACAVFVIIEGWKPNLQAAMEIKNIARAHRFHVEFRGHGIVG